mmetsp:Transcript_56781/g.176586  ORF Transcript_56781/g.176586 Transcript_56781/m.176586 type:complete len:309 (-) Transcript_56781:1023-1949(-)
MGPKCPPPRWRSSEPGAAASSRAPGAPRRRGRGSNWSSVPAPTSATSRASWPPPARQSQHAPPAPVGASASASPRESEGRRATALSGRSLWKLRSSATAPRPRPPRSQSRTCMSTLPQLAIRPRSRGKATWETGPRCASSRASRPPSPARQKSSSPLACTEQRWPPPGPAQLAWQAAAGSAGSSTARSRRASGAAPPPLRNSSSAMAAGRLLKLLLQAAKRRSPAWQAGRQGSHSTHRTTPGICTSASCCADSASQRRTELSAPQESRSNPSGLTEQAQTAPLWPSYHLRSSPSGHRQAMTTLSLPQV